MTEGEADAERFLALVAEREARSSSRTNQSSKGRSGDRTTARKERPLMRIERASVSTLVIWVKKSLTMSSVDMVNKSLTPTLIS